MFNKNLLRSICLLLLSGTVIAAPERGQQGEADSRQDMLQEQVRDYSQERERIYGWQLMSPAERQAHRQKMHSLKTREEREAYRQEHHKRMQERAKEMGVELQELKK